MIEKDTWYRCTICGREGAVGRCCGDETREPLNELATKEQVKIKESQKTAQNSDYAKCLDIVGDELKVIGFEGVDAFIEKIKLKHFA